MVNSLNSIFAMIVGMDTNVVCNCHVSGADKHNSHVREQSARRRESGLNARNNSGTARTNNNFRTCPNNRLTLQRGRHPSWPVSFGVVFTLVSLAASLARLGLKNDMGGG